MDKLDSPEAFHLLDKNERSGSIRGYDFRGWDYEGGWLVSSSQLGVDPEKAVWVNRQRGFYTVPRTLAGKEVIEITPEHLDLSDKDKDAIIRMAWCWEIGEPMAKNGTCVVQALAIALDLTVEDITEMFVTAFRNPQIKGHIIEVLQQNGYRVSECDGIGHCPEHRRLVLMRAIADQTEGHVVLVYENDVSVFDPDGRFKKVGDFMWASHWGYEMNGVLVLEKP
jgi:hypothetical protein